MVNVATPAPFSVAVPMTVSPSWNLTWPVGVPPAEITVAVNVTEAPGAAFAAAPLKEQVTAALKSEPGLASINVEVNPADGTVTLTGTAYSEENKTKASEIALNVPGVMSVQNHLVVKDMT